MKIVKVTYLIEDVLSKVDILLPAFIIEFVTRKLSYTCLISSNPGADRNTTNGINSDEFLSNFKDWGLASKTQVLPSSIIALTLSNFVPRTKDIP